MNAQTPTNTARAVPWDPEAEQAMLGAILINNDAYDRVADLLRPDHFREPLHARIYETIATMRRSNRLASPLTLKPYFEADPALNEVGGFKYLAALPSFAPTVINAADFARMVVDHATRRAMVSAAEEMINTAIDPPPQFSARDHVEEAERALYRIADGETAEHKLERASSVAQRAVALAERSYQQPEQVGATTGLRALDTAMGKLCAGDLVVLGGATSMGKTALGQQIAMNVAKSGKRVAVFSIEMRGEEYVSRHLAQISRVPTDRIEEGKVTAAEIDRIVRAQSAFDALPLFIDDSPRVSVAQIRSRARRIARQGGLGLILADHLRFVEPEDPRADERRQLQQITRDAKGLAKELGVPVLLIAHLNRDLWNRENKRPILSDLYGAAAIEQNADIVMFVHRESYWLRHAEPTGEAAEAYDKWMLASQRAEGKAEVIVAKRRRGKPGRADLRFTEWLTLFEDGDNLNTSGARYGE